MNCTVAGVATYVDATGMVLLKLCIAATWLPVLYVWCRLCAYTQSPIRLETCPSVLGIFLIFLFTPFFFPLVLSSAVYESG